MIAHPPCERWGNFYFGSPENVARGVPRKKLGDDGGCFSSALTSLYVWGGVLEHPANSKAWAAHELNEPPFGGGWIAADMGGVLWTCSVEQGHFGHRARKPTWLLASRVELPTTLPWGPSSPPPIARPRGGKKGSNCEVMGRQERMRTPLPFRDLLLSIARSTT